MDVVLNGCLPNPRHGAMSNNEDTLYLLVPGFRSDEDFEHYFDELDELANDLVQQSRVIREQMQEIRDRYVSRYDIDEGEIDSVEQGTVVKILVKTTDLITPWCGILAKPEQLKPFLLPTLLLY